MHQIRTSPCSGFLKTDTIFRPAQRSKGVSAAIDRLRTGETSTKHNQPAVGRRRFQNDLLFHKDLFSCTRPVVQEKQAPCMAIRVAYPAILETVEHALGMVDCRCRLLVFQGIQRKQTDDVAQLGQVALPTGLLEPSADDLELLVVLNAF